MTKLSCALRCSRDESCNSFTFCSPKVCYLTSEKDPNEMTLVDADKSCRSYFNKKAARGISKLNQALETTSTPITQSPDTFCFPSSKGNGSKCIEITNFEKWYWICTSRMSWDDAKKACQNSNGVLLFSKTSQDAISVFMDLIYREVNVAEI